ncbi:uncharacterized protein LOC129220597 [Uloborus diversus]|uniref:uncharacterized protein LOC129220597 n=1 Tax=Uloborus diversus TaxID=327109 RepID=UPI00240A3D6E|nr:uncharacterized protein LOC129220597 [Uloborus diversus]
MLPEAPVQPGAPVHLPRTSSQSSPLVMTPATPTTSQNALHQSPAMQISSSEQNLFQKLLRSFHLLRMEVKEIKATLDLLVEQSNNSRNQSSVAVTNIDVKLPLEDFEGVQNLERLLEEERNKNYLLNKCKNFGGSCFQDHTRRILKHLFTDETAELFSWTGSKGGKRKFMSLKIADLVIEAVLKESGQTTRADVENVMKNWLRHAKDRADYRKFGQYKKKNSPQCKMPLPLVNLLPPMQDGPPSCCFRLKLYYWIPLGSILDDSCPKDVLRLVFGPRCVSVHPRIVLILSNKCQMQGVLWMTSGVYFLTKTSVGALLDCQRMSDYPEDNIRRSP